MKDANSLRAVFLADLEKQLVGPADGETEVVSGRPFWRYLAGMLFPADGEAIREDAEGEAGATSGDESDPAVSAAYDRLPSSMGISCLVSKTESLRVQVEAGRYHLLDEDEGEDGDNGSSGRRVELWRRSPLKGAPGCVVIPTPVGSETRTVTRPVFDGAAEIVTIFRPRDEGHLATVTLVNRLEPAGRGRRHSVEATLFQCRFTVQAVGGDVVPYPDAAIGPKHDEDEELDFIYRARKSFGIGHGCAASWDPAESRSGLVSSLDANPFPRLDVRGVTNRARPDEAADRALDIGWLADDEVPVEGLNAALSNFVDRYELWVSEQAERIGREGSPQVAARIVERQRAAVERMRVGVAHLTSTDPVPRRAFRLAQRAIVGQFEWAKRRGSEPFDLGLAPASSSDPWIRESPEGGARWHPFQLAFQLAVVESVSEETSKDRSLVDLLWFPTGGGKTEAYLAVAAFEMFRRRLRYQDSGTAALMRYTLRLLTSQQFERCAGLISAMELLRRSNEDLGEASFRLGLWVGDALTPNRLDRDDDRSPGAKQLVEALLEERHPENPFLLASCPRCGTRIVPATLTSREAYGVDVSATHFRLFCPDERCALHDEIPVSVVDDDLFERPPTFLIGTIDKFARLAWDARPRRMFGSLHSTTLPPSLVIQDELHLITGPLGTIAGGYEAGLETVIRQAGVTPKYLASTATIQRAEEQCAALYGRKASVFPPPGLDADDSYFSRTDVDSPGRTYVGVMGTGPYSSLTTLVQASAAAAFAAARVAAPGEGERDGYWTQIIYHNSRKELGKTTTMLRDDVRTRLEMLQQPVPEEQRRGFDSVEELSANLKGSEVGRALERLAIAYPDNSTVDAVACTNMLSVGVDVSRLGLMIMKSQPKTTAEYIQATSRVGRDAKRPPGVVITLYSPHRPRDRSHFEDFQGFHMALYRAVEPSSVTPFAEPARRRTLHAALVVALRLGMGWEEGRDASKFDPDDAEQKGIIQELRRRIAAACRPSEVDETLIHFDGLIEEWLREKEAALREQVPLTFDANAQLRPLLDRFPAGRADGLWPTLNSMRHVDGETPFAIRGAG